MLKIYKMQNGHTYQFEEGKAPAGAVFATKTKPEEPKKKTAPKKSNKAKKPANKAKKAEKK